MEVEGAPAAGVERPSGFFVTLGGAALDFIREAGAGGILFWRGLLSMGRLPRSLPLVFEQMRRIGVESLPLVIITSIFTGAVTAVQAAYQLREFVPEQYIGTAIYKSVTIELGPVLTALVVGCRVSASIAAELGTMRVTEQVDAMEAMAIDPVRYLAMPRIVAGLIMLPIVTVFADALAIGGGFVVSNASLGISPSTFVNGMKMYFFAGDVFGGLIKAFVFGGIITLMGCLAGFRTSGGAVGVGQAATRAVVASCVLILVSDYVLATLLFKIIFG
ncbi:MAG: MlaE family lipid ABC transporter permease subunit [Candidatus Eisenbacteria bacterium]|nr:MlaE family lipid ABC transporter permease subunit [Candidatus Eisenbacteria bacterium]